MTILARRAAGTDHEVVTTENRRRSYRRQPCPPCPWRRDAIGAFPAEAFVHSANTAYDMSRHEFACHESGLERTATCAGYLLRGAARNLSTRLAVIAGTIDLDHITDAGLELHEDYRAMAIANGVAPDHPALAKCRSSR